MNTHLLPTNLFDAICERFGLARQAAQIKGTIVVDTVREEAILTRAEEFARAHNMSVEKMRGIYHVLLTQMRQYQKDFFHDNVLNMQPEAMLEKLHAIRVKIDALDTIIFKYISEQALSAFASHGMMLENNKTVVSDDTPVKYVYRILQMML